MTAGPRVLDHDVAGTGPALLLTWATLRGLLDHLGVERGEEFSRVVLEFLARLDRSP